MNEDTIIENTPIPNESFEQNANKAVKGNAWVNVTLGGVSGILMGAGLMYGGSQIYGKSQEEKSEEKSGEEPPIQVYPPMDESRPLTEETTNNLQTNIGKDKLQATEVNASPSTPEIHHVIDVLHVADVKDNLSFGEAFAAARAEVGPGGVFTWHNGVYNTYTVEEWNAMSPKEHAEFASTVHVSVPVHKIPEIPTDANPDIVYVENLNVHIDSDEAEVINTKESKIEESGQQNETFQINNNRGDHSVEDVHVIGTGKNEAEHTIYAFDVNNDNGMDVAIVDVDDSHNLSEPDVIVRSDGSVVTFAELNGDTNVFFVASNEEQENQVDYEDTNDDVEEYNNDIFDENAETTDNIDVASDYNFYLE